jgi:cytoskeletal protein CcmA (bactofilin family)
MWNNAKKRTAKVETLIGPNTEFCGDIVFSGGLHVDGSIRGNVIARDDASAVLTLSEHGMIEGEVRVPTVILNGTVLGHVRSLERVELASHARVTGNVYYNMIEMAMGAEVNGNLVHCLEVPEPTHALERVDEPEARRLPPTIVDGAGG